MNTISDRATNPGKEFRMKKLHNTSLRRLLSKHWVKGKCWVCGRLVTLTIHDIQTGHLTGDCCAMELIFADKVLLATDQRDA